MALSKVKKIDRNPKEKPSDLIDSFIDNKASISKPKKEVFFKAVDVAKQSLIENNDLVTQTLAKVYLEQKHYNKAISAYEKLILKYPEKNSFFANQIKLINKLKDK
jgi:tetratricopeptide (TPR) repeat protein